MDKCLVRVAFEVKGVDPPKVTLELYDCEVELTGDAVEVVSRQFRIDRPRERQTDV